MTLAKPLANIPLPIVERGIMEMTGKPGTLMACERAVTVAYEYWRNAMGAL